MILDTSILIDVLIDKDSMQQKLEKIGEKATTTAVNRYELLRGSRDEKAFALLEKMNVYQFDANAADACAHVYKGLQKKGRLINELDVLIASIAISHNETLVTRDGDFKSVEGLKVLVL